VCTECERSTYSRWIIECPLWVSHSEQAWTHAWQPMQRFGSRKKTWWSGTMGALHPGTYCWGSSRPAYSGGAAAFRMRTAHTLYSGILDTGSWAAMVARFTLLAPAQW